MTNPLPLSLRAIIALFSIPVAIGCSDPPYTGVDSGGGSGDAGRSSRDGGSPGSDGGLDGGAELDSGALTVDAATPTDAGPMGCGTGPRDVQGVAANCSQPECFDSSLCVTQQLDAQGYVGYAACGMPLIIDPGSSAEACGEPAPFEPLPGEPVPERRCGEATFDGTVRFFCAPDGSRVVARFSAEISSTAPGVHSYLGHDYWAGSGGGSGDGYSRSWPGTAGDRFFGFQAVDIPPGGATHLQVWFFVGDTTMYYGGGFSADLPPT